MLTVYRRKDVTDKVEEKLTPDSEKSTTEKAQEGLTGTGDSVASKLQPDSEKSSTQKASDDTAGIVETAKQKLAEAADVASEQIKKTGMQSLSHIPFKRSLLTTID